jgi:hypothetical protein
MEKQVKHIHVTQFTCDNNLCSLLGRLLVQIWSFSTLLLCFAYLSNFRASLIAKEYERPIQSYSDILKANRTLYMPQIPLFE